MDHSLPSPRSACSLEQSMYSPAPVMKQPPDYDCATSQYHNPPSVSSLPSEDYSINFEQCQQYPQTPAGPGVPSFKQLLEEDDEPNCGVYQPVSHDTGTFATLNTVRMPYNNVINYRDQELLELPSNQLMIEPHCGMNIDIYNEPAKANCMDKCDELEELSPSQSENLDLALETIKAECEGADRKVKIKEELKTKIRKKRSLAGLSDVDLTDAPKEEGLTPQDIDRKERRKASNRKAAAKCRKKKIEEQHVLVKAKEDAEAKLDSLQRENERLRQLLNLCKCSEVRTALLALSSQGTTVSGSTLVPKQVPKR